MVLEAQMPVRVVLDVVSVVCVCKYSVQQRLRKNNRGWIVDRAGIKK